MKFSLIAYLVASVGLVAASPHPPSPGYIPPVQKETVTVTATLTKTYTKTYCPPGPTYPPKHPKIDTKGKVCKLGGGNPDVTITKPGQTVTSTVVAGPTQTNYIFNIDQFIDNSQDTYVTVIVLVNQVIQQNFVQIWAPVSITNIQNNIQNNIINFNNIVNKQVINKITDNSVTQIQNCPGKGNTCLQANGPIIIDNSVDDRDTTIVNNNNVNINKTLPAKKPAEQGPKTGPKPVALPKY